MTVGITGGSGTGKTLASIFFENRGFLVIDCDKLARSVCSAGSECVKELAEFFGSSVIDSDGSLMRRELGKIVFSDKQKLQKLNEITHKYITAELKRIMAENAHRDILIDAPLLFEAGLEDICDVKLCILADHDIRIKRIAERDLISPEDAKNRIDSQKDDDYYISRCDYAVYNNGEPHMLISELTKIFGGKDGKK